MYRSIKTAALVATLTILGAATLTARSAEAQNLYGGFDVSAGSFKYDDTPDTISSSYFEESTTAFGLHFGFRPNRGTFGYEVSYAQSSKKDKSTTFATDTDANLLASNAALVTVFGASGSGRNALADDDVAVLTTETSYSTLGVDAMGYFPVSGSFEVIGTAGLVVTNLDVSYRISVTGDTAGAQYATRSEEGTGTGFRIGFGGQFNFSDRFNVRGLVRYAQPGGDLKDSTKSLTTFELGLNLLF